MAPRHGTAIGAGRLKARPKSHGIRSETIAAQTAHSKELCSRAGDVSEGLAAELFDVGTLTSNLAIIADWRDELLRKLDRASLRFELCGLDAEEQDRLAQEIHAFTRLCRALLDVRRA